MKLLLCLLLITPLARASNASASASATASPTAPVFSANRNAAASACAPVPSGSVAAPAPGSSELDVKGSVAHLNLSQLPADMRNLPLVQRITPPSDAELKSAYQAAQAEKTRVGVLMALSKPYATKDIDYFDMEVFNRWHEVCTSKFGKDWAVSVDMVAPIIGGAPVPYKTLNRALRRQVNSTRWSNQVDDACTDRGLANDPFLNPMALRCIALVRNTVSDWELNEDNFFRPLYRLPQDICEKALDPRRFAEIEYSRLAHQKYVEQTNLSVRLIDHLSQELTIPLDIAALITDYGEKGLTVDHILDTPCGEEDWRKRLQDGAYAGCISRKCVTSLAGAHRINSRSLMMPNNCISVIPRNVLRPSLTTLSLHYNVIASIEDGAFAGQDQLYSLAMPHNCLTRLSQDSLRGPTGLRKLDLSYNRLQVIEDGALGQLVSLKELNLDGNRDLVLPVDLKALAQRGDLENLTLPEHLKNSPEGQEILAIVATNKNNPR